MALNWTTSAQAAQVQGVKALVYSESGIGKTVLCATAPAPLMISAESGLLSLRPANLQRLFGVSNPSVCYDMPVLKIVDLQGLQEVYNWLASSHEARQFQTVCIDSLSEIGEVVLAAAKKQFKDPRQAYGELIERMLMLIKLFRDLQGKHVLMTAKIEAVKDEFTGVLRFWPSMPGKTLGPQMPYFFDEVFKPLSVTDPQGKQHRWLHTNCSMPYVAKDRSGALDEYELPDFSNIIRKIQHQGV